MSRLWSPVTRWADFRRRQLAALEQSNRIAALVQDEAADTALLDTVTPVDAGPDPAVAAGGSAVPSPSTAPEAVPTAESPLGQSRTYGVVGRPLNRHSPFYIGFFGATGALLAIGLWQMVGRLTTTLTLLIVSMFLALALNPIVDALVDRGVRRAGSVAVVFTGLLVVFVLIGFLVIPPVVVQGTELAQQTPRYIENLLGSSWVLELDKSYDVIDKVRDEVQARMTDQQFLEGVLGGILGAGRAVLNGVFQVFTVLVLTLYFLSSLPRVKHAAYAMVPATRRPRVESLSEEIMRRTGSYAIGQVVIATLNALLSYVMMTIVGIPYAAVLAVTVGLLGPHPDDRCHARCRGRVRRRVLRRAEEGAHRAGLLPRLPAARELRRRPPGHAAHRVGAGPGDHRRRPRRRGAAGGAGRAARHPGRGRPAAALRGSARAAAAPRLTRQPV